MFLDRPPEHVVNRALERPRLRLDVPALIGREPRFLRAKHFFSSQAAMRPSLSQYLTRIDIGQTHPTSRPRGQTNLGAIFQTRPNTNLLRAQDGGPPGGCITPSCSMVGRSSRVAQCSASLPTATRYQ